MTPDPQLATPATPGGERLRAVPVQFIGCPDGVLLVRGTTEIKISGERARETVEIVLSAAAGDGATRQEILECFAAPDRPGCDELLGTLIQKRFLVPVASYPLPPLEGETPQEVLYWELGQQPRQVAERLSTRRIAIQGVNYVSRQLVSALRACGFESVVVVDYPLLRNPRFFPKDVLAVEEWGSVTPLDYGEWSKQSEDKLDCLVATADFSGQEIFRQWNEWCVDRRCHFLPVILDRTVGSVGPMVVPGETACYECLRARENANFENPALRRTAEKIEAVVQRQSLYGYLPPMASILGDVAAIELVKFLSDVMPARVGTLFEINLLRPEMRGRKVLRAPRCKVCSPLRHKATVNLELDLLVPGNKIFRPMNK